MTNELKKIQLKLCLIRSDGLSEAEVAQLRLNVLHKNRLTCNVLKTLGKLIEKMRMADPRT